MILMGIFNYIDTFFFISLGITFILILLLVFHFKQRISDIEEKSETMIMIINDIVKELTSLKHSCCANSFPMADNKPINFCCVPPMNSRIIVSDESENDSDEDDDDEEDDEEEDDDEEDDDDEPAPLLSIVDDSNVKIISVDIDESVQLVENEYPADSAEGINVEPVNLHVEKIEGELNNEPVEPVIDTSKEIYRKMTLPALKALVITKGLSTDPSKLKKPELLKLLEANEE